MEKNVITQKPLKEDSIVQKRIKELYEMIDNIREDYNNNGKIYPNSLNNFSYNRFCKSFLNDLLNYELEKQTNNEKSQYFFYSDKRV